MFLFDKRDKESFIRERSLETLKENKYLLKDDIVLVAENSNFYKIVDTETDIPINNEKGLYAQIMPSDIVGNITTADRLKEPVNINLKGDIRGTVSFDGSKDVDINTEVLKLTVPVELKYSGDVTGKTMFDGSSNVDIGITVLDDSHKHSNETITSLDAIKINSGVLAVERIPKLNADQTNSGIFHPDRIPLLDASKISTGIIDIARLPAAALERLVEVNTDADRFKLTKSQIQLGDVVKVRSTLKMYKVIDDNQLNNDNGYTVFLAGRAAEVPWTGVTNRPSAMPNPYPIKIQANGVELGAYDGSSTKIFNLTADNVGSYTKKQIDDKLNLKFDKSGGTITGEVTINKNINFPVNYGIKGGCGDTDYWSIKGIGTSDSSYDNLLEIATYDNGNEKIVARQYGTGNGSTGSPTHEITLMDNNGNQIFNTVTVYQLTANRGITVPSGYYFTGSLRGNSDTTTKLQTSRTINGTSFDGTQNITTVKWGTSRNITIGKTRKSVDGSSDVSWTLDEIDTYNKQTINTELSKKLNLSGGTMTGTITLINASGSWISGKTNGCLVTNVSSSSYASCITMKSTNKTFSFGSLGDGQAGIYLYNNSETGNTTNGKLYLDSNGNGYCGGTFTATKVYNAVWNDYAEFFERGEKTEVGDIIALDISSDEERYIKATNESICVVGVHSDSFAHLIGGEVPSNNEDFFDYNIKKYIPIGLAGRVMVKVKGPIKKGHIICCSEIAGVGMSVDFQVDKYGFCSGHIVGVALEDKTTEDIGLIKMLIKR